MRRLFALLALTATLALPATAQEGADGNESSRLETWLEDTLSGAGREVTVTGFQGALSSQATMDRLEISDDDGVWIALTDITLDWTRSAVLAGRIEINALTAAEITVERLPGSPPEGTEDTPDLPNTEASDFTLPELPVSVNIGEISTERLTLGEAILGAAAELSLDGAMQLAGGEGALRLDLARTDGQKGDFRIAGAFANETGNLILDVTLTEGPGGIAAKALNLPGEPAIDLVIAGNAPIDDFTANVALSTEGQDRLAGQVGLAVIRPESESSTTRARTQVTAKLAGDLRPLFDPDYQPFFGGQSILNLDAARYPNGTTVVQDLFMRTEAVDLRASGRLNRRGWPERARLSGRVSSPDGTPVALPLSGPLATLAEAEIAFDYDALRGDRWTGSLRARDFARDGSTLGEVALAGEGRLRTGGGGSQPSFGGDVTLSAAGIEPRDMGLARAVGPNLSGNLTVSKGGNAPLRLTDIAVSGADYGVTGSATLDTVVDQLDLVADVDLGLTARDLSRFSQLAGQEIAGAAEVRIVGDAAVPGGAFDAEITGQTRDFGVGIAPLNGVFAGENRLVVAVERDKTGTRIREASLTGPGVAATATGRASSTQTALSITLDLPDGTRLDPALTGAVRADISAFGQGDAWTFEATATGPGGLSSDFEGTAQATRGTFGPVNATITADLDDLSPYSGLAGRPLGGAANLVAQIEGDLETQAISVSADAQSRDLGLGLGDLDRLLSGAGTLSVAARRDEEGRLFLDALDLAMPQITVTANGSGQDGANQVNFDARLADLGLVVPDLSGAFAANGTAVMTGESYRVDVDGRGPAGTTVAVSGRVASDASRATLAINGAVPLALANGFAAPNSFTGGARFDLSLDGPLALTSLSGQVTSSDARVTIPTQRVSLGPIRANVQLGNGRARIDAAAPVSSGGQVDIAGPVALSDGYNADLAIGLRNVGLTDPSLYDTRVSGALTVIGPLTGGARIAGTVDTGQVEIRIPSSGFGFNGDLDGLTHVNEPRAVRLTRERAGKTGARGAQGGSGPAYPLDITVNAPNQVFIRGRGLDAELGGQLRLIGTTADVIPEGGLSLIRGRLDLLGNRLELSEAQATLQGDFAPYLRVVAKTAVDDVSIRILIEGTATSPDVSFTSSPDLPEDEILSRLIFGRSVAEISPLQALRLANGVATLSGRSGGGVMGSIREGFGLADLDVVQNEGGAFGVRAGAYISDNVYTGVELDADGQANLSINLDLTPNLTARGTAGTDGNTSLGIFFEKDY